MKNTHFKLLIPFLMFLLIFQSVSFAFDDMPFTTYASSLDPYEIDVDSNGLVYISDPTTPNEEILVLNESGIVTGFFDCVDVIDFAVAADGDLYILYEDFDSSKKITKVDPYTSAVAEGNWPQELLNPVGLTLGRGGYLYVVDSYPNRILQYSPLGTLFSIASISIHSVAGVTAGPSAVTVYNSYEIERFSYTLIPLSSCYLAHEIISIDANAEGYLYVAGPNQLSIFDFNGNQEHAFSHEFNDLRDIAIGPDDMIYLTDSGQILRSQPVTPPGFTVTESDAFTTVSEIGTSDTFTVILDSQPMTDVVIDVTSLDLSEAVVSPETLTFTNTNWNHSQTVHVTGVDDPHDDGDQISTITLSVDNTSSDPAFHSLAETLEAVTIDDDQAGFTLTYTNTTIDEAGTTPVTIDVVLDCRPMTNVVIDVTCSDPSEANVDHATLTFTSVNWNTSQTVTVTGENDDLDDGDQNSTITLSVNKASSDDAFGNLENQDVDVTTIDNDEVGFTLSETNVTVEESGNPNSFTIKLNTLPSGPVHFDITNPNPSEANLSDNYISFAVADWNTTKTITVTAMDDTLVDGDQTFEVTIEVAPESALEYLTVNNQKITITIIDDDIAVPVESVEMDHSEVVISEGYPVTLTATISPDDATEPVILDWLSSDPGGLLINLEDNLNGTATIEAVHGAEGQTFVTGTATNLYGTASADCQITILKPIDYLLYVIDQCTCEGSLVANGDADKLEAFIHSVEEVKALIEANDILAAQSKLDEIYKKVDGHLRPKDLVIDHSEFDLAQMILNLRNNLSVPVTGVTLNHTDLTMFIRDTETLIATIDPPDANSRELIWTTDNKNIVRVNESGVITAKKAGTATITVTTVDGRYTASCTVTVVKP